MFRSFYSKAGYSVVVFIGLSLSIPNTSEGQAGSNTGPLVPSPSILDFTEGGGWGFAIGASVEGENAYDGSDEYGIGVKPVAAVQYRSGKSIFFWEGTELGVKGLVNDQLLLQGGARYEAGLEPGDSDDGRLDGIKKRDSHIVGFLEARYALDENWKNWVGARTMLGETDFGVLGVLAAGHRFGDSKDGSGAEVFAFSTFGDSNFINKDFGVPASDAQTSGLTKTVLGGGYRSTGVQAIYRHIFNEDFQLIGSVGAEIYSGSIGESPIAREDFETEVSLTALYTF
jgi:outer membrane protein